MNSKICEKSAFRQTGRDDGEQKAKITALKRILEKKPSLENADDIKELIEKLEKEVDAN